MMRMTGMGCGMAIVLALAATNARANLVAWWELDDTSLSTAAATVGSDGTYESFDAADLTQAGSPGDTDAPDYSVNLDHSGGQRIHLGANGGPLSGLDYATVSMWVRFDSDDSDDTMLSIGGFTSGQPLIFWRDDEDSIGGSTATDTIALLVGGTRVSGATGDLVSGQWYHVAFRFIGGASTSTGLNVFVDGTNVTTHIQGTTTPGSYPSSTDPLTAGQVSSGINAAKQFDGLMDEIAIYNHPLSDSDIAALAAGASPTSFIPDPASALLLGFGAWMLPGRRR